MTADQLHRASSAFRAARWWRHWANNARDPIHRAELRRGALIFMQAVRPALTHGA